MKTGEPATPTIHDLKRLAEVLGVRLSLKESPVESAIKSSIKSRIDKMRPLAATIWSHRESLKAENAGVLSGLKIALKDNLPVKGWPVHPGTCRETTASLTVRSVSRLIGAGAEIVGSSVSEYLGYSCGSHTAPAGVVEHPFLHGRTAGGSSSGCAVLVARGEVEAALGTDSGGSLRIPAAYCGLYAMKPTRDLIDDGDFEKTGGVLETIGPMTKTVRANIKMLQVLTGRSERDLDHCGKAPDQLKGLRIGWLVEGSRAGVVDDRVSRRSRTQLALLEDLGVRVEECTIPEHLHAPRVWAVLARSALFAFFDDQPWPHFDKLPLHMKLSLLTHEFHLRSAGEDFVARARDEQNRIRAAYRRALDRFAVLAMPTVPSTAPALPRGRVGVLRSTSHAIVNTCAANLTGHPAMTVPSVASAVDPSV